MDDRTYRRGELAAHVRRTRIARFGPKSEAHRLFAGSPGSYDKAERDGGGYDTTWARIEKLFDWPEGSALLYIEGRGQLPGATSAADDFVAESTDVAEQSMTEDEILARVQAARADLNAALDDLTRIRGEGS